MAAVGDPNGGAGIPKPARGAPPDAAVPDAVQEGAPAGVLSADERKALLNRAVRNLTREARARVQSQGEFDAVLIRGHQVNQRLHFVATLLIIGLVLIPSRWVGLGTTGIAAAFAAAGAYWLFWVFLALTGGEDLNRLSIDEHGRVSSVKSGRDPETRADFARVAIPAIAIAISGWLVIGLSRDIAFPPPPACDVPTRAGPDACFGIPDINVLAHATSGLGPASAPPGGATTSASPFASPTASSTPSAASSGVAAPSASVGASAQPDEPHPAFTVEQAKWIERAIRSLQLILALAVLLAATWFVRRMLTGRWVAFIRPVGYRAQE